MYTLEAILARESTLRTAEIEFSAAKLITLPQGICMIPMVGSLLQQLEIRYQGGTKVALPDFQRFSESLYRPEFERLVKGVDQFARYLSERGLVAYVEATFVSGSGGHATLMWENGSVVGGPGNCINLVLQRLGVVASGGSDEFATLNLGKCRSTKQWLTEDAAQPGACVPCQAIVCSPVQVRSCLPAVGRVTARGPRSRHPVHLSDRMC